MRTTSASGGVEAALEDHVRIYEAVISGAAAGAEAAARHHIARLRRAL